MYLGSFLWKEMDANIENWLSVDDGEEWINLIPLCKFVVIKLEEEVNHGIGESSVPHPIPAHCKTKADTPTFSR